MQFPDEWKDAFEKWWLAEGLGYDPDTDDIPWFDKRKALAEKHSL